MNDSTSLTIPLVSLSKEQIDARTEDFLNEALENHPPDELYVFAKQMQCAADYIVEKLKGPAFEVIANRQNGKSVEILGHKVSVAWPEKWTFTEAVAELEKQHKLELDAVKAAEKAGGQAKKVEQPGRITVVIRPK